VLTLSIRGFSLIELLVVMTIMGAIAGISLPNMIRLYDSMQARVAEDSLLSELQSLGATARLAGQGFLFYSAADAGDALEANRLYQLGYEVYVPVLPQGWGLFMPQPLVVHPNGVCLGGELELYLHGELYRHLRLDPPFCRVTESD